MMLLLIGLILLIGGLGYLIYYFVKFNKDPFKEGFDKKDCFTYVALLVLVGAGFSLLIGSIFAFNPSWADITSLDKGALAGKPINYVGNIIKAIIFSFLFGISFTALWTAFSVYFYKRKLNPIQKKRFKIVMLAAIAPAIIFFLGWTDALGYYASYPLPSGFHIGEDGFKFFTAFTKPGTGLNIAFYGIVIVSGAGISYLVGDHLMYKAHHRHEIYSSTLIVGFIAGILGARAWYVVGNYQREFAGRPITAIFEIWNGGLTILGGAAAGIIFGVLWFKFTHKDITVRQAVDFGVPTILLAQALGRFGNFFNIEVYGQVVPATGIYNLLPSWLIQQMSYIGSGGILPNGYIHVPLFLIEAILNIGGYFIISKLVPFLLKKVIAPGDLCGAYLVWYGILRFIMEPLRDGEYNMGTDNSWSVCNSLVYIIIGAGVIGCAHLYLALENKKEKGLTPFISGATALPCIFFPLLSSITISSAKDGTGSFSAYSGFEIIGKSPLYLVAYIMVILSFGAFIAAYFLRNKNYSSYFSIGGMGLGAVAALLIFLGTGTVGASSSEYVNLSYGFFLVGTFILVAAALSLMPIFFNMNEKKKEKIDSSEEKKEIPNEAN